MTETARQVIEEVTTKDSLGTVVCTHYKDFWAYVEKKKMTKHDLLKMKPGPREDFFMRWKHGMTDMSVNWEFEYSLRTFLKNFKDVSLSEIDPYFQDSVRVRRAFDTYCDQIKVEINLWAGKSKVPQEVQDVVDQIGGTLVSEAVAK